jgi:hypothetical protein
MSTRQPHGWVVPLPSGAKARCGGPGLCPMCRQELRELGHGQFKPMDAKAMQERLGKEFESVLFDNLWDLYAR